LITIVAIIGKAISLNLANTEIANRIKELIKMNLDSEMKIETTILIRVKKIINTAGEISEKPKWATEILKYGKTFVIHIINVNTGKVFRGKTANKMATPNNSSVIMTDSMTTFKKI